MKIVAAVRTLNEARNVADFCAAYDWADMVLVADGGSTDETVRIAEHFPNVWVREFEERVDLGDGYLMNPQGQHLNFLIDWAVEEGTDWIVFDDCDCTPNPALKRDGREILESVERPVVGAFRLHLWGSDQYFPKMSLEMGEIGTSLWAWRPGQYEIRGNDENDQLELVDVPPYDDKARFNLDGPPYCLLHRSWPDEETIARKWAFYKARNIPVTHPLKGIYAPPEPVPGWVWDS